MSSSGNESSDTDSSDEMEPEFEDDVHTINQLRNQITELKSDLEKNVYLYEKHILLIDLLKRVKDVEELKEARRKMMSAFPLTEELWLQWVKDDEAFDEDLFQLAVKDYISVDIWIEYAYFMMRKLGQTDGPDLVRGVYEKALTAVGIHPMKGLLVWEAYREFEMAMLQAAQPPAGSVATSLQLEKAAELTKKIEKLYLRQLAIPMKDLSRTFEEYKSFNTSNDCDAEILKSFKKASLYWEEIKPLEDKLIKSTKDSLEVYKEYINFELSRQQPSRIQCIFERAIKDNCLDVSLWLQYITYMRKLNIESLELLVHERSVRNCPWSSQLWVKYIITLERSNASNDKIKKIFNDAMLAGFNLPADYLNLWSTYIDYLRRKVDWSSEKHEEALTMLRSSLEHAISQLNASYGKDGDPNCSLQQYWAFVEAKYCHNMTKARELWTQIMQCGFGDQAHVWLEYISIERSFGDVKHCRKVFQRAINSVSDWPEHICEAYILFERQEGNISNYEDAITRCAAQLARVEERRANEALKEQDHKKKFKKNTNTNRQFNKQEEFKDKSKQTVSLKPYQRKNHEINQTKISENKKNSFSNEQQEISSDESLFKKPLVFERKLNKKPSVIENSEPSDKDTKCMPPPPPPKNLKRSNEDKDYLEKLLAKKPKNETTNSNNLKEFKENQTVFVSNLDYSVTADNLKEIFSKIGEVSDVRVVSNYKKQSKGYAYVEFYDEIPVEKGLKLDREPLDGRPMFVSRCDSNRSEESKIKFNLGLEKNKLFVKNLLPTITKENLTDAFSPHGNLKDVRIVTFRNGHSKGIAYVEYMDQSAASQAVMKMDGFELGGQKISVAISNPPPRNTSDNKQGFVPSLGGGKKDVSRGNARTQLSFLPRTFTRQTTKIESANVTETNDNSQAKMSNNDFRKMLLKK